MKTFKLELTVKVADLWIEDGFDLNDPLRQEQLIESIQSMLPYAHDHEVQVEINKITTNEKK